jgi:chemotaxis protein MotB
MPPASKDKKKIIIKKKKGGDHGGHHGGSWKVAYADFVTAMMAFFLVMWIVGMDDKAKESVQGYFSNPVGFKKGFGSGSSPLASGQAPVVTARSTPLPARLAEEAALNAVQERLEAAFSGEDLEGLKEHVDVTVTHEGLRIEFGEGLIGDATFSSGSAVMTSSMLRAIAILGSEIAPLPNSIIIEGHTDAVPLMRPGGYSNWELSSDRANAARRALQTQGVDPSRIVSVRGFADRNPKIPDFREDPRNRRVSILLPFRTPESGDTRENMDTGDAVITPNASAATAAPGAAAPPPGP